MSRLLHHPILTLVAGFAIIGGVFAAYITNPTGVEAFPATEAEFGNVFVVARGNYSPSEVRDLLAEVEDEILQVHGIQDVIMTFGSGDGFMSSSGPPDTIGMFQLQLINWNDRVPAGEIFQDIRERVADISGLEIQIRAQEDGPPAGKAINMRVESTVYDDLAPAVASIRDFVEHELGDTIDVEDGRPSPGIDWQVTIDRAEAAKYGIGVRELAPYVQLVTSGVKLGSYRPDDASDELDIKVRLPQEERTFDALDSLRIVTAQGLVPVSNFIERKAVPKVVNIVRRNDVYFMPVAANLKATDATGEPILATDKIEEIEAWLKTQDFPSTVSVKFGGAEEQIGDANAFIGQAFTAAVFIIFLVLLLEYNSFYQVLVTLTTVLMSVAGVLLGMLITGMSFSAIMTGLGIVALAGIVVKNGIVLIDTYNHYRRDDGVEPIKAMLITISQRVRPVLLTATVTALGVIPMWANVEFDFIRREIVVGGIAGTWFVHLSAALVSGLFFSTALTLIMVPVMITAPSVIGASAMRLFGAIGAFLAGMLRAIGLGRRTAVTPDGVTVEIPEGTDSAKKYITADGTGLVEREEDGVTVVSRQAAE